ncbi:MAG: hypothetical protein IKE70_01930 [Bacilli bacterium]|nr:hypothetical protein [Bacilli bacterium]
MKAPRFDSIIRRLDNRNYNPQIYTRKVKVKLNELYDLLDKIKPILEDDLKKIYFSAERGTIEDYGNYEELKEFGEVSSYEEFEKYYKEDYPDDKNWYQMSTNKYKNYRMISINSNIIIYADMDNENDFFESYELLELLDFLIQKVKECIKKLEDGTYNEYIANNYSYKNKFGVIKRKDYWELYPDSKKNLFNEISQDEMNYFIENARDQILNRIKNMTSRKYFECVALAYKSIGYEIGNLSDKELYLKYADGRDEGLCKIDEDSKEEFDIWYNDKTRFGGHPWEIIRGHSFARVDLYVAMDEEGYYLSIDGNTILRKIEIVKIFNAFNKNNIPIRIFHPEIIKESLKGNDYIGIVPRYIVPIRCESYFKKYKPREFTHVEDYEIVKYIKWEPLEKIELNV